MSIRLSDGNHAEIGDILEFSMVENFSTLYRGVLKGENDIVFETDMLGEYRGFIFARLPIPLPNDHPADI